jgi:hypothetical protein
VVALAAFVAVLAAGPPAAYVAAGSAHVPLAISAWCWAGRCGAPIAASKRTAVVPRGHTVTVELRFAPRSVSVFVNGIRTRASARGHEITWVAARGGGLTIRAVSSKGWVTYVGRLRVR